ncbi:uncharacterized protein LOC131857896 [Cryptomeria japonica]|uniref:uncharacterized protein LOC131857896 n=1 Tax=Cryptomeria japonica TaxID=3369 RepID=UPI0027D9D94D|nr:uncharacterized protein LOC131857896 [Cryptomeria japonica]
MAIGPTSPACLQALAGLAPAPSGTPSGPCRYRPPTPCRPRLLVITGHRPAGPHRPHPIAPPCLPLSHHRQCSSPPPPGSEIITAARKLPPPPDPVTTIAVVLPPPFGSTTRPPPSRLFEGGFIFWSYLGHPESVFGKQIGVGKLVLS